MAIADASNADYELLDFGGGRKFERFGDVVVDRPCPSAEGASKATPSVWQRATARYDRTQGEQGIWTPSNAIRRNWSVSFAIPLTTENESSIKLAFHLQASPFGHVGIFPEQFDNWQWITRQIGNRAKRQAGEGRPLRVLNLFAYTGGSTLAAAAAGAEVVHIDAARNIVQRARRNADLSSLSGKAIRWITEEATKFCQRELKRGSRYDAIILDPPSYGRGPKGEPWKISEHLLPLFKMCGELTSESRAFVLASCHTPGMGPAELGAYLAEGLFGHCGQPPAAGELFLETREGRRLPSGVFALARVESLASL